MGPTAPRAIKVYIDESRQTASPYRLLGSIWVEDAAGWPFVREFHDLALKHCRVEPAELKWTRIPPLGHPYFSYYKALVDLFFTYTDQQKMFFRALIVGQEYDMAHDLWHQGDPEVGFHKLYFNLVEPILIPACRYHLRIAERPVGRKVQALTQEQRLDVLKQAINTKFRGKHVRFQDNVISTVEIRRAKERRLIQLADILVGAVGYHYCGLHKNPNAKQEKVELAAYIATKLGRPDLCFESSWGDRRFNIFRLRPGHHCTILEP